MAEELPPLIVTVLGDASGALKMLDDLEARLAAFSRQDFTANIGANDAGLVKTVAEAESMLEALGNQTATPEINGDDAGLDAAIARAQIAIAALAAQAVKIPIDGDDNPFLAVVAELHAMVEEPVDIPIDATGLKSIMSQILVTRGAMAAIKTDAILAGDGLSDAERSLASMAADQAQMIESQQSVADAWLAVATAQKAASTLNRSANAGDVLLATTAAQQTGGGKGGSTFLATLLGSGGARGAIGFGTPLLPRIPLAGFGTLGSMAGLGLESIVGLGAGLVGFAAHGLLGGMALGLTSLGVSAAGMGTDMAGIGQALGDVKQYGTLQANLQQTAAVYGKGSTEYAAAQYAYNQWAQTLSPAYIAAVSKTSAAKTQFGAQFDKYTGPAATTGANILTQGIGVADKFLPTIGKFAAENMTIIQKALQPLFTWLQGPGLKAFTQIEQVFTDHLPKAMHAFDQAVELVIKTVAHFAPQTGGLISFLDKLFTRLNGPGFQKFIGEVQGAIDAFRVWEKFGKAVVTMIDELFKHDAKTGQAFIETLTKLIDKFNTWANTVAGGDKLHEYLEAHKKEVIQLVDLFGNLVTIMGQVHLDAGPALMTLVGDVLKLANALLQIPGINKILSYIVAFEILGRHINILRPFVTAFNGEIKKLALQGLAMLGGAISSLGGPFAKLGGWMQGLGTTAPTEVEKAATAMQTAADQMAQSAAQISEAFSSVSSAATSAATDVGIATDSMDAAMAVTARDAEVSAATVDTALGTEGIAGDLGGAGLAAGGLARGAGTAAEGATAEEVAAESGAALFAKGSLGAAAIGLIGVQLYNAFAEKKLSKIIGTNLASTLGDVGTGAALGTAILPGVGTAVGAAGGLVYGERNWLFNKKQLIGDHPDTALAAARNISSPPYAVPPKPTQAQQLLAKDSTLQKEIATINLLKGNVAAAKAQDGVHSVQYTTALKALNTTQQKYFPHLGKHEDLTKVSDKIEFLKSQIALYRAGEAADNVTIKSNLGNAKDTLKTLQGELQTEKTGKASKDAIDLTKSEITIAKNHLANIKGVVTDASNSAKQIKTYTAQLNHLTGIQTTMSKVNTDTDNLKSLTGGGITVAKLPSQKLTAAGYIQLVFSG